MTSWGAEHIALDTTVPNTCEISGGSFWWFWQNQCGGVNQKLAVPLSDGAHQIRIRISGTVQLVGYCGALPTDRPLGPLGIPYFFAPGFNGDAYDFYSLLMTFVWLDDGFNVRRVPLTPVNGDSSVVEGTISTDWPARGLYIDRGQPLPRSSLTCQTEGDVQVQVFLRDLQHNPTLALNCTPSIVRGGTASCTAGMQSAGPSDVLTITDWSFNGQLRKDGDVHSTTWGGQMVQGGTVRVRASINGVPQEATAPIAVTSRTWPKLQPPSLPNDSGPGNLANDLPPVPSKNSTDATGYTIWEFADSHAERTSATMPYVGHTGQVAGGPNDGLWFVTSPLDRPDFLVHHTDAMNPGNPFYQKQHYGLPGATGWLPYCTQTETDEFRERALHHEGLRQTPISPTDPYQPARTHFTFFQDWILAHDINSLFEKQFWNPDPNQNGGFPDFQGYLDDVWTQNVDQPQTSANIATIDTPTYWIPIFCRFR